MSKFKRSWTLFKRSMQVVGSNKSLLLFPIIVFILTCIIALFFLVPMALWDTGHSYTEMAHWKGLADYWGVQGQDSEWRPQPLAYVLVCSIYMLSMFLATFLNVAFFNEILNALNDRPVSIAGGLRFAFSRLRAILAWSLFAGLVGLVIKALEQRVGLVGRWVMRVIGITWSVASVFAIPVIVREERSANPVRFLKTSASLLRKTWGEALIGYAGIAFGGWLIVLAFVGLLGLSAVLSIVIDSFWPLAIGGVLWLVGTFAFAYVLSVAGQVYRAALYIYATEGVVPAGFDQDQMDMAWKVKTGRKAL